MSLSNFETVIVRNVSLMKLCSANAAPQSSRWSWNPESSARCMSKIIRWRDGAEERGQKRKFLEETHECKKHDRDERDWDCSRGFRRCWGWGWEAKIQTGVVALLKGVRFDGVASRMSLRFVFEFMFLIEIDCCFRFRCCTRDIFRIRHLQSMRNGAKHFFRRKTSGILGGTFRWILEITKISSTFLKISNFFKLERDSAMLSEMFFVF